VFYPKEKDLSSRMHSILKLEDFLCLIVADKYFEVLDKITNIQIITKVKINLIIQK